MKSLAILVLLFTFNTARADLQNATFEQKLGEYNQILDQSLEGFTDVAATLYLDLGISDSDKATLAIVGRMIGSHIVRAETLEELYSNLRILTQSYEDHPMLRGAYSLLLREQLRDIWAEIASLPDKNWLGEDSSLYKKNAQFLLNNTFVFADAEIFNQLDPLVEKLFFYRGTQEEQKDLYDDLLDSEDLTTFYAKVVLTQSVMEYTGGLFQSFRDYMIVNHRNFLNQARFVRFAAVGGVAVTIVVSQHLLAKTVVFKNYSNKIAQWGTKYIQSGKYLKWLAGLAAKSPELSHGIVSILKLATLGYASVEGARRLDLSGRLGLTKKHQTADWLKSSDLRIRYSLAILAAEGFEFEDN